jgi:class 3 adenylate cyclase/YHS domain-containing protein
MVDGEVDVVFLIADLAGYTALTEAHGGTEAAKVIHRYVELAERALRPAVGLVERVGDELLIVGSEPRGVLETAIHFRDAIDAEPMFPGVRMGIHGGRVVRNGGRYYGTALNLTARLAAHARPGQILCSDVIAAVCETRGIPCRGLGPVRFRNLPVPVGVFELAVSHPVDAESAIDPVCRMHVTATTAPARLPYGGATYLFCSFECARAFTATPDRFVPAAPAPTDP